MISSDVIIIGAGLCGLVLGNKLKRDCLILEKSRGVGGRVANRRIENQGIDHGAPYLVNDSSVMNLLKEHYSSEEIFRKEEGLYIEGAMTRLPKDMSGVLNIKKSTRVETIVRETQGWRIGTDTGEEFRAREIVITAPMPQALELLQKNNISFQKDLHSISYTKAVMAIFITKEGNLPDRICPPSVHSILSMKDRGLHPRGFIIRATAQTSEELFDSADEDILNQLSGDFLKGFSVIPDIEYRELKKWKYVTPMVTIPEAYREVAPHLYLSGDAFLYPDVRGAIASAEALAAKLNLAI